MRLCAFLLTINLVLIQFTNAQSSVYFKSFQGKIAKVFPFENNVHVWKISGKKQLQLEIFDKSLNKINQYTIPNEWEAPGFLIKILRFNDFYYLFIRDNKKSAVYKFNKKNGVEDVTVALNKAFDEVWGDSNLVEQLNNSFYVAQPLYQQKLVAAYNIMLFDSAFQLKHKQTITVDTLKIYNFKAINDSVILVHETAKQILPELKKKARVEYNSTDSTSRTVVNWDIDLPKRPKDVLLHSLNISTGNFQSVKLRSDDSYYMGTQPLISENKNVFVLNRMSLIESGLEMFERTEYCYLMKIDQDFKPSVYLPLSSPVLEDSLKLKTGDGFRTIYTGFNNLNNIVCIDLARKRSGEYLIRTSLIDSALKEMKSSYFTLGKEISSLSLPAIELGNKVFVLNKSRVRKSIYAIKGYLTDGNNIKEIELNLDLHRDYKMYATMVIDDHSFILPYGGKAPGFVIVTINE